jgi:RNA polymerase sigma-70 factor, ECF subfamily
MSDSDVLEKNPHISRSALETMHEQLFAWALSRSDYDRAVAEDLVQQTYVELLTGKAKFEGRSSLKTFVFAVLQNLAKSRYRRIASRLKLAKSVASETVTEEAAPSEPGTNPEVWSAVQALPQRQRDIIELVFCRDMTIDAASEVIGVTSGTGRVHYDRAKKALRERLNNSGDWLDA